VAKLSLPAGGYPQYVPLAPAEKYGRYYWIEGLFRECAEKTGYFACDDVVCRKEVMFEIIERVEKRRIYFRVFHGLTLSEQNEIALYCFWTAKLAPFFDHKRPDRPINAVFAAFMFLRMINNTGCRTRRPVLIDGKYVENLIYAFLYRDLSKEAVMAMADALLTGAAVRARDFDVHAEA